MSAHPSSAASWQSFLLRVGIVAGAALLLLFLYLTITVWLMLFGAVLLALLVTAFTRWLSRYAHVPRVVALGILLALVVGVIGGLALYLYPTVVRELERFGEDWPRLLEQARQTWVGQQILNGDKGALLGMLRSVSLPLAGTALGLFSVGSLLMVGLFITLFLAFNPHHYLHGFFTLVPVRYREETAACLRMLTKSLERWAVGQLVAMAIIGLFMVTFLRLLDLPYPYTLGILGGLLQFVPFVGPILWAVPAVLITATTGLSNALLVLVVYMIVQTIEGNFLTPMVQRRAVQLPPVLTILSTVVMGLLFGPLALILATPMLVVLLALWHRYWPFPAYSDGASSSSSSS